MSSTRRSWNDLIEFAAVHMVPLSESPGGNILWLNSLDSNNLYLGANAVGGGGAAGVIINSWPTPLTWSNGVVDTTMTLEGSGTRQLILDVAIATAATAGFVTFEVYADSGYTDVVWSNTWDLAAALDTPSVTAYLESETTDTMYIRVTNNTGGGTFTGGWVVQAEQITLSGSTSLPTAADVGDGLSYSGTLLQANTHLSVGTTIDNDRIAVAVDETQPARILKSPAGLILDGVVDNSSDELVGGTKRFTRLGVPTISTSGPPVTVEHYRGELIQDTDGVLWQCIRGIASGDATDTWAVARPTTQDGGVVLGSNLAAGATESGTIATLGNAGTVQRLRIWCWLDGYVGGDFAIPFRMRFYPNTDHLGRDQLSAFAGVIRGTDLTTAVGAGSSTLAVTDATIFDREGLLRLSNADGSQQEFGRVIALSGGVTLDDALVQTPGYSIGDPAVTVVELPPFPFWLTDGLNETDISYQIENDHATQAVRFAFDTLYENNGYYEWSS